MRVLKWIVDRVRGRVGANETPIGWTPNYEDLEWKGLAFTREQFAQLQKIEPGEWRTELHSQDELFLQLHDRLPKELIFERELLASRF
jgi:phosphoenolpyruvate carboxykinase (GTP)